jgi:hypothetical protein
LAESKPSTSLLAARILANAVCANGSSSMIKIRKVFPSVSLAL